MSSLSYFGSRLARILASMCMALAFSSAMKRLDIRAIPWLRSGMGNRRMSSICLVMVTAVTASSMLLYSQSSACRALSSMVMTAVGLGDITWLPKDDMVRDGEVNYSNASISVR
jgi:hypothetical protein